jgi:glutamyl-tRNA reductase
MHRIGIVGVSYRHASAGQVAQFALAKDALAHRLGVLREALHGAEVLYLSTCNRVEVIYASPEPAADRRADIFRALTGREPVNGEASAALRAWTGEAAVEHLLLVACGMDSAQAGEQEIYVQLRAAWQAAREAQVSGPLLDRILSEAMNMARIAHRITTHDAPSLADLAVARVLQHLQDHAGPAATVGLVGVSPMTRRCGLRLRERGVGVMVINRSLDTAQELATELGATALTLAEFAQDPASHGCAALVCASGATEPVIDRGILKNLVTQRPLLMDFGLPPNVDVDAARVLDFTRVGMDDLVQTARDGRVEHLLRLAPVRAAIDAHLARLRSELAARAIGPQLARLRDDFERITAGEVDRLLRETLPDLDDSQRRQLSGWGRTLAHRLAHLPLSGLRAAAEHAGPEVTDAFFEGARLSRKAHSGDKQGGDSE